VTTLQRGDHDPLQRGFTLPNEEIFLDGAVDPYFRGVVTSSSSSTSTRETSRRASRRSTPPRCPRCGTCGEGRQFFTEFGRLNQQHPHAWDFVDQPLVIGRMFGPEGSPRSGSALSGSADAVLPEASPPCRTATAARLSASATPRRRLFGRTPVDRSVRGSGDLLYAPRWVASFEPTDSQTLVVGLSGAFGPNASGNDTRTEIYGGDVYWKWKPAWQAGGFPFVSWQTEALGRRYEAGASALERPDLPPLALPRETLFDWGVYSQVVYGFTQRWEARGDWVSGDRGARARREPRRPILLRPDLIVLPSELLKVWLVVQPRPWPAPRRRQMVWMQVEFRLAHTPRTSSNQRHHEPTHDRSRFSPASRAGPRVAPGRPPQGVATTPDLAAVAHAVGGDDVEVATLARPTEDPHFVDAKPSHVVTLNRADVLIEGGADLEVGWLPALLEGARNPKIAAGAPGRIRASEGLQLLDVPAVLDRSQGDIHAAGNPHLMKDPANARIVARRMADTFCAVDAVQCPDFKTSLAAFETKVAGALDEWTKALAPFKGMPIVTYHPTWRYFAQRFGLVSEIYLEPKPGIPPSPPHLAEVMQQMTERKIRLILVEPYQSRKTAEAVAERTNGVVVDVCQFPGGLAGTENDYVALIDADVKAIVAGFRAK
jgi:zinc/manganese transport system substrate-binding protein